MNLKKIAILTIVILPIHKHVFRSLILYHFCSLQCTYLILLLLDLLVSILFFFDDIMNVIVSISFLDFLLLVIEM